MIFVHSNDCLKNGSILIVKREIRRRDGKWILVPKDSCVVRSSHYWVSEIDGNGVIDIQVTTAMGGPIMDVLVMKKQSPFENLEVY